MTISSDKIESPSSKRFVLCKITPARDVTDDLELEGSGIYSMTFPFNWIEKVEREGTELTAVSSTPGTVDNYYFNETTKKLEIKLTSSPGDSNVIIVYYNLYYTTDEYRVIGDDPETPASNLREWEGKILELPSFGESVKDIISGTFSFQGTAVTIENLDRSFQEYLTTNDSFYQKEVKFWYCIDGIDNIQKVYLGKIDGISITDQAVTLSIFGLFSALDQPAYFGDTIGESFFLKRANSFSDMDPAKTGTPCPLILGKESRGDFLEDGWSSLDPGTSNQAVCTDYAGDVNNTSENREWGLCRVLSDGLLTLNFGTVTSITTNVNQDLVEINYTSGNWSSHNLTLGRSFKWSRSGTDYFARVVDLDSVNFKVTCLAKNNLTAGTYTTGLTFHTNDAPIIAIKRGDGGRYIYPYYETHFTHTLTETTGGQKYLKITFADNFESYFDGSPTDGSKGDFDGQALVPTRDQVFYKVWTDDTNLEAGLVLKRICEEVGIATNDTTFTSPNVAFGSTKLFTQVPLDKNYENYLQLCQKILASVLGYLKLNNAFQAEYKLLEAPSSTTVIDNELYQSTLSVDIDYSSLVTEISVFNVLDPLEEITIPSPSSNNSNRSKLLNGVDHKERMEHVLVDISDRIEAILAVRSTRLAIYTFKTATKLIDNFVGDDIQLDTDMILGSGNSKDLTIISIEKTLDDITVRATDLEGL